MDPRLLKFRPAAFAFAIFCFFLPFVTMSCPGGQFRFSGVQLVTGTTVQDEKLPAEPLAIVVLVLAILGLALSLASERLPQLGAALCGLIGPLVLLALKSKMEENVTKEGNGMVQISFNAGFWLTLLGLAVGCVLSLIAFRTSETSPGPSEPDPSALP